MNTSFVSSMHRRSGGIACLALCGVAFALLADLWSDRYIEIGRYAHALLAVSLIAILAASAAMLRRAGAVAIRYRVRIIAIPVCALLATALVLRHPYFLGQQKYIPANREVLVVASLLASAILLAIWVGFGSDIRAFLRTPFTALRALSARVMNLVPAMRNLAINCTLVTGSLVLSALVAEGGYRLLKGVPVFDERNLVADKAALLRVHYMNVYDPVVGWRLGDNQFTGPGTGGKDNFATGQYGIRMNRHEIVPVPKGAIIATGDSFTAGSEVSDWETWPAYLEQMLKAPVVNAAAGGWGADQIVLRAEALMPVLDPAAIVVSFMVEDIVRTSFRTFGGGNKPYFTLEDGRLIAYNQPVPVFAGRSNEIGELRSVLGHSHLLARFMELVGRSEWWYLSNVTIRVKTDMGGVSCRLLERLKLRTDAARIPLYFVLQYGGSHVTIWEDQPPYAKQVEACARTAGIPTVNTWESLRAIHRRDPAEFKTLYNMFENDTVFGHMSPRGNRLIAELIAEEMRSAGAKAKD